MKHAPSFERSAVLLMGALLISACDAEQRSSSSSSAGGGAGSGTSSSGGAGLGGTSAGGGGVGGEGTGGAVFFSMTDSLENGTAHGHAVGGTFGPDGWTVTASSDRIWYVLPRLVEGSIQFTMSNVTLDNLLVNDNEVFALYEGGHGIEEPINYNPEYRNNFYKSMIRIYGQAEVGRVGQQKLMWGMCPGGAPGYGDGCPCGTSFFEEPFGGDDQWDGSPQTLRVEWGNGITRYLRNGTEVLVIDWSASGLSFGPQELHFSLGTSRASAVGDASMPVGAVFSDVVVEGYEGAEATCP